MMYVLEFKSPYESVWMPLSKRGASYDTYEEAMTIARLRSDELGIDLECYRAVPAEGK